MPKAIPLVKGIRELFIRWSDGYPSTSRIVKLTENVELYALYKTQYLLTINSDLGDPQMYGWYDGYGWYNSSSPAQFSVRSPYLVFNAFDHWGGDFSGQSASDNVIVDEPKVMTAYWRWDYNYIAGFVDLLPVLQRC